MRFFPIVLSFATILSSTLAQTSSGNCTPKVVTDWELGHLFNDYVTKLYINQDVSGAFQYVKADYIQHNPFTGQGSQAAIQLLNQIVPPLTIQIYHLALDQGIGWIHWRGQGGYFTVETAVVDIVRWNGSCIQEHWDVIQSLPGNATNPLALF